MSSPDLRADAPLDPRRTVRRGGAPDAAPDPSQPEVASPKKRKDRDSTAKTRRRRRRRGALGALTVLVVGGGLAGSGCRSVQARSTSSAAVPTGTRVQLQPSCCDWMP